MGKINIQYANNLQNLNKLQFKLCCQTIQLSHNEYEIRQQQMIQITNNKDKVTNAYTSNPNDNRNNHNRDQPEVDIHYHRTNKQEWI